MIYQNNKSFKGIITEDMSLPHWLTALNTEITLASPQPVGSALANGRSDDFCQFMPFVLKKISYRFLGVSWSFYSSYLKDSPQNSLSTWMQWLSWFKCRFSLNNCKEAVNITGKFCHFVLDWNLEKCYNGKMSTVSDLLQAVPRASPEEASVAFATQLIYSAAQLPVPGTQSC